jgi:hypothetical protein
MEAIPDLHVGSVMPVSLSSRNKLISSTAFIAVFTVGSTFAIIFQCVPVAAGYDLSLRPPTG